MALHVANSTGRQAPCSLDVIIVGAGFAGLAAAYTIAKSGHKVRVLDQQPHFGSNNTGGLKLAPNLTRVLRNWGLGDALAAVTTPAKRTGFISLETGEIMNHIFWDGPVMGSTGGQMLLGVFDDILRLVYDLAVLNGAEVLYGKNVVAYHSTSPEDRPIVVLEGGERLDADCIISAGGLASLANISNEFETMENWIPIGWSLYTTIISGDKMRQDPELNELLYLQEFPCWMGTNRFIFGYPIKQNTAYVLEFFWPDTHAKPWPLNIGIEWIDWPLDAIDLSGCEPRMDKLCKLITHLKRTRCLDRREPLSDWVNETNRIVVVGDAAHPFRPCMPSAAASAVEDANALGTLFSHIQDPSALPSMLEGYHEIRQPACDATFSVEIAWMNRICLPPGPERDARDAEFRAERDLNREQTEDELRARWENLGFIFGYDAAEAAEDWWTKWGRLQSAAAGGQSRDKKGH